MFSNTDVYVQAEAVLNESFWMSVELKQTASSTQTQNSLKTTERFKVNLYQP